MEPFVFISWSGAKSKEYALVIKNLLEVEFDFKENDNEVFVSEVGINGSIGWLETVREKASLAKIIITCITPENKKSPWIHYEVGIGSYMISFAPSKKIIPVLFDMTTKDLDGNLTMLSYHQMVCEDDNRSSKYYQFLLQKLLYQVDSYLVECNKSNIADVTHLRINQYKKPTSIPSGHDRRIKAYAKKLVTICEYYGQRDFFISRPMLGVDENTRIEIDKMLKQISERVSNKQIFFAKRGSSSSDLPTSRLSIIKGCSSFILIYPSVHYTETIPPSSCLVELGMALALNKRLHIFVESDASTPKFMELLQERAGTFEKYNNILELTQRLINVIKEK